MKEKVLLILIAFLGPFLDVLSQPFITTWKTDNTGTSSDTEISIPTTGGGYNYNVYWEDVNDANNNGVHSNVTGNLTINFGASGTYRVEISGDFPRIYFNNSGDKDKLLTVDQWGGIAWSNMEHAFSGCSNLTIPAPDAPDLSSVTDMTAMFTNDTSLTVDSIHLWDVSNVNLMVVTFSGAKNFNQNLSNWDVSGVTDMTSMLDSSGLSVDNYDNLLIGWSTQGVETGVTLGAAGLRYSCDAAEARRLLTTTKSWTIVGDRGCSFITTWQTDNTGTSSDTEITIPTTGGGYNYNVYWEDVNDATNNSTNELLLSNLSGDKIIDFGTPGTYRVEISGDFPRIYFNYDGDKDKLLTVDQWGGITWSSMEGAFYGCSNLTIPAPDAPDLSSVTNMYYMFQGATSFNQDLSSWDVGNVTNMHSMFEGATKFNQDLSSWDVGNVTNMYAMFYGATKFNQDLSGWDISDVTDMGHMFRDAIDFDQDLSVWNVSGVEIMYSMFYNARSFDQDLSGWNVSLINDMEYMFRSAISFDQDLSNWDVSGVTNMTAMLDFSGLSVDNYDNLLIGWSTQGVETGVTLGAAKLTYSCDAAAARKLLTTTKSWTIVDDQGCPFITTWQTDNTGTSSDTKITIPTTGTGYSYDVYWEDVNNSNNNSTNELLLSNLSGSKTIDFGAAGTYRVEITGDFPRIYFNNSGDKDKLLTVDQWGGIAWSNMEHAFSGCSNLTIPAPDAPDLSSVTDMTAMFTNDTSLTVDSIHLWDVSNVNLMVVTFSGAKNFNQNLSNWDVSGVTDMTSMLDSSGLSVDNYDNLLIGWSTQGVETGVTLGAAGLRYSCDAAEARRLLTTTKSWTIVGDRGCSFITTWQTDNTGTSSDTEITIPTDGTGYNYNVYWEDVNDSTNNSTNELLLSNLSGSKTIDFLTAGTYRVEISGDFPRIYFNNSGDKDKLLTVDQWGGIAWSNMEHAFSGCSNLTIPAPDAPDLSSVTDMTAMFTNDTSLTVDSIHLWDVSNVNLMVVTFSGAKNFNQNLSNWDVSGVTDMTSMLDSSGLSVDNYDNLLIGWSTQGVETGVTLGAAGLHYSCDAAEARRLLTTTKSWTIVGDRGCSFITTWKTDNTGPSSDTEITIPTTGGGYNYNVYWEDVNDATNNSTNELLLSNLLGSKTIDFGAAGTYRVEISGDFPRIYFNYDGDKDKLLTVDQWGGIAWSNMEHAFSGCSNLTIPAPDAPDLSSVTDMTAMFTNDTSLTVDSIHLWDVSNVNLMVVTFSGAKNFNQNLSNWDVSGVMDMHSMFSGATSFNQDLSDWDVGNVSQMGSVFRGATSFDQNLGDWDVSNVVFMTTMLDSSGLSTDNYDNLLIGWSTQVVETGVTLGAAGLTYSCDAAAARKLLTTTKSWTIVGDRGCSFITTWKTDNTGPSSDTEITIPTTGGGYNYNVYWEDVNDANNNGAHSNVTGNLTINFGASGTYRVEIRGDFPRIYVNNVGDKDKLLTVDQWGGITWSSMERSFYGCSNLTIPAPDAPDLSSVTDMSHMLNGATSLTVDSIHLWNVSSVTHMFAMFSGATSFNQDLSSWDVGDVTNISVMFNNATIFNQDLSSWDVGDVTTMSYMFNNATIFNQDLSGWDVSGVTDMTSMLDSSGLSTDNYDNLLIGWSTQVVETGVTLGAAGLTYSCDAAAARKLLTTTKSWTIVGDRGCSFITTWKTDNTGPSSDTEITIPTTGGGYNYNVYWEDVNDANNNGAHSNVTGNLTINFGASGTYRVEIRGDFPRIYVNNVGDKDKLLTVDQWGGITWSSMERSFYGCSNLTIPAPDAPDLSSVTDMSHMLNGNTSLTVDSIHLWNVSSVTHMFAMFSGATSFNQDLSSWDVGDVTNISVMFNNATIFNQDLSSWDVGDVTNMSYMFNNATIFNQDLSGWDVSSVTNMTGMLNNSGLSTDNYDNLLIGWSTQVVETGVTLGAAGLTYSCDAAAARKLLTTTKSWTIVGDRGCSFITTWKTDNTGPSSDTEITIPTTGGGYNYNVYWEDVNDANNNGAHSNVTGNLTINFGASGTYRVEIFLGDFPWFYFNNVGDKDKLLSVDQWGGIEWNSMRQSFSGCSNLTIPAPDAPDLSSVTDMTEMFTNATSLTVDSIHLWNVSSVTHMYSTFLGATSFNQDLSSWDVSSVMNMYSMFRDATSFNQDLSSWNVSNVSHMGSVFSGATSFNQDLSDWDVSSVTTMLSMFSGATSFDQNLGDWDVSTVGISGMGNMLDSTALSVDNYDSLLIGWSTQGVKTGTTLGAAGLTYSCDAVAARRLLTTTKSWTIVGDRGCSFITTWKTDNTGPSSDTEITIPTTGGGYSYNVYWEDVNNSNNNSTNELLLSNLLGSKTIDFGTAGTYRVEISGDFPRIYFNNSGDKDKLLTVDQWGGITWSNMEHAFSGCSNLTIPAPDAPDLSSVTDMTAMFTNDTSLTVDSIHLWDVSNVNLMVVTFSGAKNFNQNLSNWDVSGVTDMTSMLDSSGLSTDNYDSLLIGWSTQGVETGMTLGAAGLTYSCDAVAARRLLTTTKSWTIVGDRGCSFITTWKTDNSVTFPTDILINTKAGFSYDYTVYWEEEGNPSHNSTNELLLSNLSGDKVIDFGTPGTYRVEISGDFPHINVGTPELSVQLLTVEQWGGITWSSMEGAFSGCSNLTIPAPDAPDLSSVTDMTEMFSNATSLTVGSIHLWNVSSVTHMVAMFEGATSFNQDLSSWDVSSVTNMASMFSSATSFDQPLNSWDVGNVTNMSVMFNNATIFNQDLSSWDVGDVTNMEFMFRSATSFDQPLNSWNVSSVTDMTAMFSGATNFDQDLGDWDVSSVNNMTIMFSGATSFDQPLNSWEVDSVTSMSGMFRNATNFDQALGDWNISSVTNMDQMLDSSALSVLNYDNTLLSWEQQPVQEDVELGAEGLTYCTIGEVPRQSLIDDKNWNIIGDTECLILPITLLSIEAKVIDGLVHIIWETASEIDNEYFTLERSKVGNSFEELSTIEGGGNSNQRRSYSFIDEQPYIGTSYYKLKQTDFSGATVVVGLLLVKTPDSKEELQLTAYPNPFSDTGISIVLIGANDKETVTISIVDVFGRYQYTNRKQVDDQGNLNLILSDLNVGSIGLYIIQVFTEKGIIKTSIVKN